MPSRLHSNSQIDGVRIPLMLEVNLYLAGDPNKDGSVPDEGFEYKYEMVGSQNIRLGNMTKGIFKFVPIEFPQSLASLTMASVH